MTMISIIFYQSYHRFEHLRTGLPILGHFGCRLLPNMQFDLCVDVFWYSRSHLSVPPKRKVIGNTMES